MKQRTESALSVNLGEPHVSGVFHFHYWDSGYINFSIVSPAWQWQKALVYKLNSKTPERNSLVFFWVLVKLILISDRISERSYSFANSNEYQNKHGKWAKAFQTHLRKGRSQWNRAIRSKLWYSVGKLLKQNTFSRWFGSLVLVRWRNQNREIFSECFWSGGSPHGSKQH